MKIYLSIIFSFLVINIANAQPSYFSGGGNVKSTAYERVMTNVSWVIMNSTVSGYVYMRGTNGFFAKPGGSGMIQSVVISGATNMQGTLHIFGYPPMATTNGTAWSNDLFEQGALYRLGPPHGLIQSGVSGTNYQVSFEVNIPVINRDNTTNLYFIYVAGSTSVTNYPGIYGTNYVITISGVSDDTTN